MERAEFSYRPTDVLEPDVSTSRKLNVMPAESGVERSGNPTDSSSFPKVLRLRLDRFFADSHISPKADREMWFKIAIGLAMLVGSWAALYVLRPGSFAFVALY